MKLRGIRGFGRPVRPCLLRCACFGRAAPRRHTSYQQSSASRQASARLTCGHSRSVRWSAACSLRSPSQTLRGCPSLVSPPARWFLFCPIAQSMSPPLVSEGDLAKNKNTRPPSSPALFRSTRKKLINPRSAFTPLSHWCKIPGFAAAAGFRKNLLPPFWLTLLSCLVLFSTHLIISISPLRMPHRL